MHNQEIRASLDKYWEATVALDLDRIHDIYHDDVIVEFPQSGERITGKRNIYELRAHYPAKLGFKVLRVRGEGSLWISEIIITYDGRPVNVLSQPSLLLYSPILAPLSKSTALFICNPHQGQNIISR
jgi:hypothetical protein